MIRSARVIPPMLKVATNPAALPERARVIVEGAEMNSNKSPAMTFELVSLAAIDEFELITGMMLMLLSWRNDMSVSG